MDQFIVYLRKYSAPAIFLVIAIAILIVGMMSRQPIGFTLAAIFMFIAAVFSFLFSSGFMKGSILVILGIIGGLAAIVFLYMSFSTVRKTVVYERNYEETFEKSRFILSDIRSAQKAYAEKNGRYAPDLETLVEYIKNGKTEDHGVIAIKRGKTEYVISTGGVPPRPIFPAERAFLYGDNRPLDNNMTEEEAYRLSKMPNPPNDLTDFKRDTVQISLFETKFNTVSYKNSRNKAGLGKFYPDSLVYIPNTKNQKWTMKTKDSVQMDNTYFPAIYVGGKLPYSLKPGGEDEIIFFGDETLSTNSVAGSWEN